MIDNHVTSLETSKRLKELGVPQESVFGWRMKHSEPDRWIIWTSGTTETFVGDESASAFLASELGEMLPLEFWRKGRRFEFATNVGRSNDHSCNKTWGCGYYHEGRTPYGLDETDLETQAEADTEADARAKLLIYLIEQGIVDPKKLNKE
jgi:hypothetical protein